MHHERELRQACSNAPRDGHADHEHEEPEHRLKHDVDVRPDTDGADVEQSDVNPQPAITATRLLSNKAVCVCVCVCGGGLVGGEEKEPCAVAGSRRV